MKFKIDQTVIAKYPDVKIGVLVAKGIDNSGDNADLNQEARSVEEEVRGKLDLQTLVDNKKIANWREAYSAFGSKPKTYKNSVEALLRRVLKNEELPNINKIVNIYNMISIKHMLPAGGDNLDKIDGDIRLTVAQGGEQFTILGSSNTESTEAGEVIYRDDKEVLCRRWNWRECDKSKMEPTTTNVALVLEGLKDTTKEEVENALEELKSLVSKYCGGTFEIHVLTQDSSEIEI